MKTFRHFFFVIFLSLLYTASQAQLHKQWDNTYTTADTAYMNVIGLVDAGNGAVIKTTMVTKSAPPNQYNRLLMQKIDASGAVIWDEEFTHSTQDQFGFYAVDKDANGNLYFAGQLTISQSEAQWYVASFNNQGQLRWERNVVENTFSSGYCKKLKVDNNGNIYVLGSVNGNGESYSVLLKYDSQGNEVWVKKDTDSYIYSSDMILANNGDIITCNEHYEITRYSPSGTILWSTPDTAANIYVTPFLTESADGSIYGISFLGFNYSLKKVNASGQFQWNIQNFAEYLAFGDFTIKLKTDAAGNVYAVGINSLTEQYQTAVFKFAPNGNEIWRQPFQTGNANINMDEVFDALILPNGNLAIAGTLFSGGPSRSATAVLDAATGNVLAIDSSTASVNQQILVYNSGGLYVTGTGDFKTALAKFSSSVSIHESNVPEFNVEVYPNPFMHAITIYSQSKLSRYELKDVHGKTIKSSSLNGNHMVVMDELSAGIYLLQIINEQGKSSTHKIVKQ